MRLVICEDNLEEQKKYSDLFLDFAEKSNIDIEIICFESGDQLLFNIEDMVPPPEAIFMDINMPGVNGFKTVEILKERGYSGEIVFLTVSDQYVLKAFDVNAFHLLPQDLRLKRTIFSILKGTP